MKKIIEILSEITICQSQHFRKNLSFYSSGEAEKMLLERLFEKNLRLEKKLEDEFEFEKTFIWWHSLGRKTQIVWEIADLRKSQRWWPWGQEFDNELLSYTNIQLSSLWRQKRLHLFALYCVPLWRHKSTLVISTLDNKYGKIEISNNTIILCIKTLYVQRMKM